MLSHITAHVAERKRTMAYGFVGLAITQLVLILLEEIYLSHVRTNQLGVILSQLCNKYWTLRVKNLGS